MATNPIKYSDLIQPDSSIQDAISQLTQLGNTYASLLKKVKDEASGIETSLKGLSGSTEQYRKAIAEAAAQVDSLSKSYESLVRAQASVQSALNSVQQKQQQAAQTAQTAAQASQSVATNASAEAKSYKELESSINAVIGTRSENLKMLAEEEAAIREINAKLKELRKQQDATNSTMATNQIAKLTDELLTHKAAVSELRQVLGANTKMQNAAATSMDAMSQELGQMREAYRALTKEERDSTFGEELLASIQKADAELKELDASIGNHQRNVGNYQSSLRGLNSSFTSLIKELPAMATSADSFFAALSNNIPILVNRITQLEAANKKAAASGKATIPVWKSITSSLLSWNTAVSLATTLLVVYGGKIVSWITELVKGKKALDTLKEAQENFNSAVSQGSKDAQQSVTRLNLLYNATQDVTRNMNERRAAAEKLQEMYPKYFSDMTTEEILAGKAKTAYDKLRDALIEVAMARAYEKKIEDNSSKIIDLKDELKAAQKDYDKAQADFEKKRARARGAQAVSYRNLGSSSDMRKYADEIANINDQIKALEQANKDLADSVNIEALLGDSTRGTGTGGTDTATDRTQQIQQKNLNITKQLYKSETALIEDEIEKQRQALLNTYEAETADLMNKYNNDKDLTEESRENILKIIGNKQQQLQASLEALDTQYQQRQLQKEEETLQLRLATVQSGSEEEAALRLKLLENQRQQELLRNSRLVESMKQDEADINAKYDTQILNQEKQYYAQRETLQLEQALALEESRLNAEGATEEEITRFKLEAEKQRQELLLRLVEAGAKDMSDAEIEAVKNTITSITNELNKSQNKIKTFGSVYDMIGEAIQKAFPGADSDVIKNAIQGVETYVSFTMSNLSDLLDAELELAQQRVELAEEAVDSAQSRLDSEIEARNNGYAANVSAARKELALAKKTQQEALAEEEKVQRQQEALDSLTQASSLVTASANIWKSFSGLGIFGPALAVAAIATMWASFAAAKIKAKQVTSSSSGTDTYGEGGFEILEGGSHASGNDIDLGTTNSRGRRMRAEGGEALAIINKRSTRKYRKALPEIVRSINKGEFEEKYMNAFDITKEAPMIIQQPGEGVNLDRIEGDLRAIKKSHETRMYTLPNGNMVLQRRNVKRIIKVS